MVTDGFIASTAALAAARLAPRAADAVLASHRSVEAGHRAVLRALGKEPLLDLDLRLGEGTGAALAFHLVEAAARVLDEMATFEGAGSPTRDADRWRPRSTRRRSSPARSRSISPSASSRRDCTRSSGWGG